MMLINNKGEHYTEKGLQKMLFELVPDKNIGIDALRSIYASHYLPKLQKNQINRVAFLMRTSFDMLSTNYLKKIEEDETKNNTINKNNKQKITKNDINVIEKVKTPRDTKAYLNE